MYIQTKGHSQTLSTITSSFRFQNVEILCMSKIEFRKRAKLTTYEIREF